MNKAHLLIFLIWAISSILFLYIDFDVGMLWGFLSLIYGLLYFIAYKNNSLILKLFIGIVFITHTIVPVFFMIRREEFSYSGWSAVKNFDFELNSFIFIYTLLFIIYTGIVIFFNIFKIRNKYCHIQLKNKINYRKYNLYLVIIILLSIPINIWMFDNNIGLTGMGNSQDYLPFKIGGGLYYLMRFIIPAAIFYLYSRSERNNSLAIIVITYGLFAGVSQVSKATLVLIILPIIIFAYSDKKSLILVLSVIGLLFFYSMIDVSRDYVYLIVNGVVEKNSSLSIFEVLYNTFEDIPDFNLMESLYSLLSRIGGGQDLILGYQYDSSSIGRSSWDEFFRIFLNQPGDFNSTFELYGFEPVGGFSAGNGGFSSMILQIVGKNYWTIPLLIIWISAILYLGEWFVAYFWNRYNSKIIGQMVAGGYIILLYALGNIIWLYYYILLLVLLYLFSRMRIKIKFPSY